MVNFDFEASISEHVRLFVAPEIATIMSSPPPNTVVPFDSGELLESITIEGPTFQNSTMTLTAVFNAGHGYILENLPVIRPTRAQALSFIGSDGSRVFSQAFTNVHFRWFSRQYVPWLRDLLGAR